MGCFSSKDGDTSIKSGKPDTDDYKYDVLTKALTIIEPKKYISDRVAMHLSVHDIIGMDNDKSQSDPFIVVYQMEMSTETFKELDRTEVIQDTHDADFAKEFIVPYIFNEYQLFRFDVYDSDSKSNDLSQHDYLGSSTFILGEIIHENGSIQTKKLLSKNGNYYKNQKTKKYSTITVFIDTNHNENMKQEMIQKFVSFNIKIVSNLSSKNTFCSIYRMNDDKKIKVYSTEVISNNKQPKYNTVHIDTFTLARSDYNKELRFIFSEHFSDKNDKVIYMESITMNDIILNNSSSFIKNKLCLDNISTLNYNLTDYLYDSFDISVMFGIDFTASNGDPNEIYSLHYIYNKDKLSPYQIAIRAVGNIIASYDSDNLFPVYGFGAKLIDDQKDDKDFEDIISNTATNFVFPINKNNKECVGIYGVEEAYRNILQKENELLLSAPTNFSPMLQKVINDIENQNGNNSDNNNQYFIFLIITDGQITDMNETKKLIKYAANKPLPLSIIIIGVGNDDFDNMIELDGDDGQLGDRDIVQFVEINQFIDKNTNEINKVKLSAEVLYEVPNQLLSYMAIKNIQPNLEKHKQTNIKDIRIGTMYNINDDIDDDDDDKQQVDDDKKDNKIIITADTPIPFGWEKCYDHNGNVFILDKNGRKISNNEFYSMININYNNINSNKKNWFYPEVDLVFCLDVTGSMQNEIDSCKNSIEKIVCKIKNDENAHIRFGYVAYRDHPPQESTFVTKSHQFTSNLKIMKDNLSKYSASGGGDIPEAAADGLNECLLLNGWRQKAVKICILITDAPPHGIGCNGDKFANGPPNGLDLIDIAQKFKKKGILLYILGCEPDLKSDIARDVYRSLCRITYGKYIGIREESYIAPIIIKSVSEEIHSKKLEYLLNINSDKIDINNKDKVFEYFQNTLNKKQKLMQFDDIYGNYNDLNVNTILNECNNIADIRKKYKKINQPSIKSKQNGNVTLKITEIDDICVDKIIQRIKAQK